MLEKAKEQFKTTVPLLLAGEGCSGEQEPHPRQKSQAPLEPHRKSNK